MTRIPICMEQSYIGDSVHSTVTFGGFMHVCTDPDLGRVTISIDSEDGVITLTCTKITGIDCVVNIDADEWLKKNVEVIK